MRLVKPEFSTLAAPTGRSATQLADLIQAENFDGIVLLVSQSDSAEAVDGRKQLVADHSNLITTFFEDSDFNFGQSAALWPNFGAKAGEILELTATRSGEPIRVYLLGIGARSAGNSSVEDFRKAGAALGRKSKGSGLKILVTLFSEFTSKKLDEKSKASALAFLTAFSLSQYGFEIKGNSKATAPTTSKSVKDRGATRAVFAPALAAEVAHSKLLSDAVWNTRDLIHTPSNIKNPAWLADQAKKMVSAARSSALRVNVKSGRALAAFGGLRAVGNSVPTPGPRLIEVTYAPVGSKNWPHVVLVGKGITFDTGGISLKRPYDTMIAMKSDMAGAAAILSAICAIPALKPKVRVTALLMCAENMVSGTAQRPSDVITHYGGTTVEVVNTDAEGRLVLADGLAYADLELDPDYLVDVATLTGAASLGLGKQYAAMYSRDTRLVKTLAEIGQQTGDLVWHMPLIDDYAPALESEIADLVHTADKAKFSAGSVTAALFLEHFAGDRTWVHLDIAGPARSEKDAGEFIKGGTGFATKLLIEWLATFA